MQEQVLTTVDPWGAGSDEVRELSARGLISARDLVEGNLVLRPVGGRDNRNLRIERSKGPSWFVKRADRDAGSPGLRHEAAVCRSLGVAGGPLARHVADIVSIHDDRVLVLELLDGESLRDPGARSAAELAGAAVMIGEALALVHGLREDCIPKAPLLPPAVFELARPDERIYCQLSAANLDCLGIVQESGIHDLLQELLEGWEETAFIHGDLRLANIVAAPSTGEARQVWFVDWEMSGRGDPAWDIGCVLGHHLGLWLSSLPDRPELSPAELARTAGRPLDELKPAMASLWRAYREAADLPPVEARRRLLRGVRFAGAALVELAFAHSRFLPAPTDDEFLHLQVAKNVMTRPWRAAVELFGMPAAELAEAP